MLRGVGDTVADVLRPVGEAILRSDDLKNCCKCGSGGPASSWAVPIINGADAIDKGADPEEVLKNCCCIYCSRRCSRRCRR